MALITDPDNLNDSALDDGSTEVYIDVTAKTIKLVETGNLDADGVTLKAVYSFVKEEWIADPNSKTLAAYDFPFVPITDEFYELKDGWTWANVGTRNLIRRSGYLVRNVAGNVIEHWAGLAVLGAEVDDQIYYQLPGQAAQDFVYAGNTAEVVQVIDDPNGDGNYVDGFDLSANIVLFNREQGQLYSSGSTLANGEASLLAPKLFSVTVGTGTDLKIAASDGDIATLAPYTGMSITYYSTPQSFAVDAGPDRDFGVVIDGNNGTLEQIYEFVQYQLRQDADIDAGSATVNGLLADELLQFVGDNLETLFVNNPEGGGGGVYVSNIQAGDVNRISFQDNTDTARTFPRKAILTLNFGSNLVNDASSYYWVWFEDPNGAVDGNEFGTAGALLVPLDGGGDMEGLVSAQASVALAYDYDGDTTGGRTISTDVNVVAVAIGLDTGQYVQAAGTITFPSATVALVAPLERNYENV
jgi:hypothetical protein